MNIALQKELEKATLSPVSEITYFDDLNWIDSAYYC